MVFCVTIVFSCNTLKILKSNNQSDFTFFLLSFFAF